MTAHPPPKFDPVSAWFWRVVFLTVTLSWLGGCATLALWLGRHT